MNFISYDLMTKTIILATIAATTILMLSLLSTPVFAPGPPKICDQIDVTNCTFLISWDFADTGSDTGPPIVITNVNGLLDKSFGAFTPLPVEGNLQGSLVGAIKTISEDTTTTTSGSTTTTTIVKTQSRNVNNIQAEFVIDGVPYSATIKTPGYDAKQIGINTIVTGPSPFTVDQTILIIPVVLTICPQDQSQCLQGFGTVVRQTQFLTSNGGFTASESNKLEALVIGPDGLFDLNLSFLQRIQGTV